MTFDDPFDSWRGHCERRPGSRALDYVNRDSDGSGSEGCPPQVVDRGRIGLWNSPHSCTGWLGTNGIGTKL